MQTILPQEKFKATHAEIRELLRSNFNPENKTKTKLWLVGIFIAPIILAGMLYGYVRAYNRFIKNKEQEPSLADLKPVVRFSMVMFGIIFLIAYWLLLICFFLAIKSLSNTFSTPWAAIFFFYFIYSWFLCGLAFKVFNNWRIGIHNLLIETSKFGTAKFANSLDLSAYRREDGLYIGGGYSFSEPGHILTNAGTRGGKGINLIVPALLDERKYSGSLFVLDVKGENAAIAARYQREKGQNVVIINAWGLLEDKIGAASCYNPLDILLDNASVHLVDDIALIAELVCPINKDEKDPFFTNMARSIISGLLLHLMNSDDDTPKELQMLWKWVRLSGNQWNDLIADMNQSDHETYGSAIRNAAREIEKLMKGGENTFGSIMATVLECTEFIKSPALQKSMQSGGFDPYSLNDGKTTVFFIVPVDKLQNQSRYLRLVVTTMMRSVVRRPNKRVTFIVDEAPALGYISEFSNALSTYAGFGVTIWTITQSLGQLEGIYGKQWETFIANCTVKQYFSIYDNSSADYVSKAFGNTSNVVYTKNFWRIIKAESNERALITPDELRRASGENIFMVIGDKPPTYFPKFPYYKMSSLIDNGTPRYEPNPYYKGDN